MKRQSILLVLAALLALCLAAPAGAVDPTTIPYGSYSGPANWFSTHFAAQCGGDTNVPVWDLTQGDLVLTYTLDMSKITQPHGLPTNPTEWEAYVGPTAKDPSNYPDSYTPYIEVGLRGEGAGLLDRLGERAVHQHHGRAVVARGHLLLQRRVARHEDRRGDAVLRGRQRHALCVVAGARRNAARGRPTRIDGARQHVHRAARLEGAGALQVLALQDDRHAQAVGEQRAGQHRRLAHAPADALPHGMDRLDRDGRG
jgi:hypothetical protein